MSSPDPGICRCAHHRVQHVNVHAPGSTRCSACGCTRYRPRKRRKGRYGSGERNSR